jgi:hypothetical protein
LSDLSHLEILTVWFQRDCLLKIEGQKHHHIRWLDTSIHYDLSSNDHICSRLHYWNKRLKKGLLKLISYVSTCSLLTNVLMKSSSSLLWTMLINSTVLIKSFVVLACDNFFTIECLRPSPLVSAIDGASLWSYISDSF